MTIHGYKRSRRAGFALSRQIDYTRLRTLSGQYADFWTVTGDALDFACDRLVLDLGRLRRDVVRLHDLLGQSRQRAA